MTPDEMNVIIAEWIGWRWLEGEGGKGVGKV